MADDIDLATSLLEQQMAQKLKQIRENAARVGQGAKQCVECGDDMPEVRQTLGFKFCVPCAEERERRKSLFADD